MLMRVKLCCHLPGVLARVEVVEANEADAIAVGGLQFAAETTAKSGWGSKPIPLS